MAARSLAGTNGVPTRAERTYLRVVSETDEDGEMRPLAILWPDGRRFEVASSSVLRRMGRWELGTYIVCWEVCLCRGGRAPARRVIWWERGRWFCAARVG